MHVLRYEDDLFRTWFFQTILGSKFTKPRHRHFTRPLSLEFFVIDDDFVDVTIDVVQGIGLLDAFHPKSDEQDGESCECKSEGQRRRIEEKLHQSVVEFKLDTFFS